MAHTASTVQRLLEDGSIKASSVAPNEMYQCHYLAHGTCFCKSPFVPGAGSSGGNRDWNSYIVAGQTPPSGLTKSGMERANLEVNSAFMLYGLTFAGVVYAGNKIIGATSATLEPAYPSVSQMGGFLNVFDWNCGVGKPFDQFISISADHSKATHAILTIEGGLPEGLDEGTPVRQYVVGKAAQVLSPIPAAAVPAAAVPAAAVPAAAAAALAMDVRWPTHCPRGK